MKSKEEPNALKKETEELKGKLAELTDEELAQVSGGRDPGIHTRHFIYPVVIETDDNKTKNGTLGERPDL